MRETDFQETSIVATFGFENRRIAEVFADDVGDLPLLMPLQSKSLEGQFVDVCEIGRTIRFLDRGVYSIALRIIGDGDSISEVFEIAQRYGGYVRGFLDGAPESLATAFEKAHERGWNPEHPKFNPPRDAGHFVDPDSLVRPLAQATRKPIDRLLTESDGFAPVGGIKTLKVGKRPAFLYPMIIVASVIVVFGLGWLGFGHFGVEKAPGRSHSSELQPVREDPSIRALRAMEILLDAARLLPELDEGSMGRTLESTDLAAWMTGTSASLWNPGLLMLAPDLESLAIDPWGNAYKVRFDKTHEGTEVRIWSMGPDGIDNDTKADDVDGESVTMVSGVGIGDSEVMDLLRASALGAGGVIGDWTTEGGVPISPKDGDYSLRPFSVSIPDSYEVRFSVERRSGDHALFIGYPARGKRVTSMVDIPLQKGRDTLRGVGIAQIIESADNSGSKEQLLPKGESREVYVRVESGAIATGIRGSTEFSWKRGDHELGTFPETFLDRAGDYQLFVGSWNSSFAIHSAELIDLGERNEAPQPRPPILLPPEEEFPRSGVLALGWSELGEFGSGAAATPHVSPNRDRSRLVAVTLEVDNSYWTYSEEDTVISDIMDRNSMPGPERAEVFQIGLFSIRVGAEVAEASGVVRPFSVPFVEDDLEVFGIGEPLSAVGGDRGKLWQVHRTREFVVYHPEPVDRSGRTKITLWSEFTPSDRIRPVHVTFRDGEWRRVPDRSIQIGNQKGPRSRAL